MENNSYRILIVDDEVHYCEAMKKILIKENKEAKFVLNGSDAVEEVKNGWPEIVLLDIKMPGIDGIETLKRIRKISEDCIVIMLSAAEDMDSGLSAMRLGANDFLRKPVNIAELKKSIMINIDRMHLVSNLRRHQKELEKTVIEQTASINELYLSLKKANLDIVRALSEAIEAKDPYTRGHCSRVTNLALNLGKEIGLNGEQMEMLEYGSLLHDIGKIGIRGAILAKPSKLTDDEYEHIKLHPAIGVNIIAKIDFLKLARGTVRHHHERHDGKGYPDGLKSWQIEIMAQIMVIADAFDAMTSSRPYRNAMSTERALQILKENSGTQFNSELIHIFLNKEIYLTNR